MVSVKKTKKTVLTVVALTVVTSLMITAAAAEEILISHPAPPDHPALVITDIPIYPDHSDAVLTDDPLYPDHPAVGIAAVPISPEQPQSPPPATESIDFDSSVAGSGEPAPETARESDDAALPAAAGAPEHITQTAHQGAESEVSLMLAAGQTIAEFTKQFDGFKYVYGAESPKYGFDCSGLVWYVYTHFGYTLPRTASRQYQNGVSVELTELQPGDLVFFDTNGGSRSISHVGIYVGDGQFIHASTSRHGVMISRLDNSYWSKAYYGAKRIITPQSASQLFRALSMPSFA